MKAKTDNDRRSLSARSRGKTDRGDPDRTGLWRSFATPEHDLRGRAAELRAPTLIVWAAKTSHTARAGRQLTMSSRGSRLEILDTGHVVFSSDPGGFLAVVEPFLESVSLRRRSQSDSARDG